MTTRNGKIARLPLEVREELNERLLNGGEGKGLVDWLNGLPEVKEALTEWFGGRAISEQNLSEWKQGGYAEWEERRHLLEDVEEADLWGSTLAQGYDRLVDRLTAVLAARYGQLLLHWDGQPNEAFEQQQRVLRRLSRDVLALQRGQQRAAQLELAQGRQGWAEHDFKERVAKEQERARMWAQARELGRKGSNPVKSGSFKVEGEKQDGGLKREDGVGPLGTGEETSNTEHRTPNVEWTARDNPGSSNMLTAGPLTPALSPEERGNCSQGVGEVKAGDRAEGVGKGKQQTSDVERPTSNEGNYGEAMERGPVGSKLSASSPRPSPPLSAEEREKTSRMDEADLRGVKAETLNPEPRTLNVEQGEAGEVKTGEETSNTEHRTPNVEWTARDNPGSSNMLTAGPLTPALSPEERGNCSQGVGEVKAGDRADGVSARGETVGTEMGSNQAESGSIKPNQTMGGAEKEDGGLKREDGVGLAAAGEETSNVEHRTPNTESGGKQGKGTQWN